MEPGGLVQREPGAGVGRAVDLVAQLAAGDPDAIDDLDGVDASALVSVSGKTCDDASAARSTSPS